jgi:hypothetical protein
MVRGGSLRLWRKVFRAADGSLLLVHGQTQMDQTLDLWPEVQPLQEANQPFGSLEKFLGLVLL